MNEEIFFIRLRDCFNAGYQMPQFCIDNNIKKPLFILADERSLSFAWEIYIQFQYDKRIIPTFSFIKGKIDNLNFSYFGYSLKISNVSDFKLKNFDKIICLTSDKPLFNEIDTIYLDYLVSYFLSRTYADIPLSNFLIKNPQVKLIVVSSPHIIPNAHTTEREKKLLAMKNFWSIRKNIKNPDGEKIETPYNFLGYNNDQVYDLMEIPPLKTNSDGSTSYENTTNPFITIRNGKRITLNQPENFRNRIYFVGNCIYFGFGVPDDKTLESQLQKFLNINHIPYRVENESQAFWGRYQDIFYQMERLNTCPGDIVFCCLESIRSTFLPFLDTSMMLLRPHNYGEIFAEPSHINELGHKALAEIFFKVLVQNNFFQNTEFKYPAPPPPPHRYGIPKEFFGGNSNLSDNKDLQAYKEKLRGKRLNIGAIVMNCNPFTLGHKYLIEYAAARVNKLYIFVVEEDKSEFAFTDRLELVKRGTKDFPNVEVIPSGKFIISQQTFSGYFNKSELQNVAVDSSEDVEIFAREIAPTLGINIRFAGEEPEDTVTRQYNDNMRNILPRYDIDFVEIPRKEINGEVISAKSVRAALKVGDFDKISKLVPKTTLDFLRKNYTTKTAPPRKWRNDAVYWRRFYMACTLFKVSYFLRRKFFCKAVHLW